MRSILLVGLGGFFGAIARHLVSALADRHLHGFFPFGTMIVNVVGCLVLGFLAEACRFGFELAPQQRDLLVVGVIGAFTTFSTLGLDTVELLRAGHLPSALANLVGSIALGLVAVVAGQALARVVFR